jgi:hypothetical protein
MLPVEFAWLKRVSDALPSVPLLCHLRPTLPAFSQNLIFRFLQNKSKIKIWLFNNNDLSVEGQIIVSAAQNPPAVL